VIASSRQLALEALWLKSLNMVFPTKSSVWASTNPHTAPLWLWRPNPYFITEPATGGVRSAPHRSPCHYSWSVGAKVPEGPIGGAHRI
jgi:hypothetical protein